MNHAAGGLGIPNGALFSSLLDEPGREPIEAIRDVTLTRPFELGEAPVPLALYRAVVGANACEAADDECEDPPVCDITWYDAVRFCNALSAAAGLRPAYTVVEGEAPDVACDFSADGFRLPTEAEWEYAARSGGDAFVYAGSYSPPDGAREPNRWGFRSMSGGVWEWCWDGWNPYVTEAGVCTDPVGATPAMVRIRRGGASGSAPAQLRVATRGRQAAGQASCRDVYDGCTGTGFRLARTLSAPAT